MSAVDYRARMRERLSAFVGPAQTELAEVNRDIEETEAKLREMKEVRSELTRTLRSINPELAPSLYKKNGRPGPPKLNKQGKNKPFGPESIQAATDFLQGRKEELNAMHNGDGFRPIDVYTRDDWKILKSDSAVGALMGTLHDSGILHLTKWVRGKPQPDRPTGKFYKVV